MKKFGEEWDDRIFPIAYLITIRTYGTWLHGDERLSVDTHDGKNVYGTEKVDSNPRLRAIMKENLLHQSVTFDDHMRNAVHAAVTEVCAYRKYDLFALNVRSNHAHVVVAAKKKPEIVADEFKKYSTRELREENLIDSDVRPWSRGRSRRYLWKDEDVAKAIDYVLYSQGDMPFAVSQIE